MPRSWVVYKSNLDGFHRVACCEFNWKALIILNAPKPIFLRFIWKSRTEVFNKTMANYIFIQAFHQASKKLSELTTEPDSATVPEPNITNIESSDEVEFEFLYKDLQTDPSESNNAPPPPSTEMVCVSPWASIEDILLHGVSEIVPSFSNVFSHMLPIPEPTSPIEESVALQNIYDSRFAPLPDEEFLDTYQPINDSGMAVDISLDISDTDNEDGVNDIDDRYNMSTSEISTSVPVVPSSKRKGYKNNRLH